MNKHVKKELLPFATKHLLNNWCFEKVAKPAIVMVLHAHKEQDLNITLGVMREFV